MKICSKMGRRAAEFMFGAAVMCFGMSVFGMQEGENNVRELSRFERIDLGCQRYAEEGKGFEKWKSDLFRFVSDDFRKQLYSSDGLESEKAQQDVAVWGTSSALTDLFYQTWGRQTSKRKEAAAYLLEAKSLTSDDYILKGINCAIEVANMRFDD